MLEKGLVQIYTGEGKGKTTAAFGLALRAAGQIFKLPDKMSYAKLHKNAALQLKK